jgi:ABC-2 type transport system ATP-binding protein
LTGDLAISTRKIRKLFGGNVAVKGLTLDVRRGEVFGFLGPNGAGKSTSVKVLLGLVKPTSGSATLLDQPLGDRQTRAKIGFLPEHFRFYDWLTARELLRLHGQLHGLPDRLLDQRIPAMLETVGLTVHANKQLRHFSKGMVQRIGLAQALINEPELLFLDEPTSGLDPVGRRLVRDIIKAQRDRGATVFLNSHLLSEVEITCDRVAFLKAGEVIEVREVSGFSDRQTTIRAKVKNLSEAALQGLASLVSEIKVEEDHLTIQLASPEAAPSVLRYLVESGADVFEFTPRCQSLEDRFLEILGLDEGL